ncbi:MAG: LysM repeat protein [Rhodothermales bacterium]|jgi:LysM repeat protein
MPIERTLGVSTVTVVRAARRLVFALGLLLVVAGASAQSKQTYTVRAGDTLYRIAVNHNMSVERLRMLNGLGGSLVSVGQVLRLTGDVSLDLPPADSTLSLPPVDVLDPPTAVTEVVVEPESVVSSPPAPSPAPSPGIRAVRDSTGAVLYGEYTVSSGQSFFDVAFALGMPADSLAALNVGHALILADGGPVRVPPRFATTTYTVKAGDTMFAIAADNGVSLGELRRANPNVSDGIRVRQVLQIPSTAAPSQDTLPLIIAEGPASVYPDRFVGRLMASGRAYDDTKFTLSHPALPFGTVVLIESVETGRSTFAEVADRMPVTSDFVVELSRATAQAIGLAGSAVRVRIIDSGR